MVLMHWRLKIHLGWDLVTFKFSVSDKVFVNGETFKQVCI